MRPPRREASLTGSLAGLNASDPLPQFVHIGQPADCLHGLAVPFRGQPFRGIESGVNPFKPAVYGFLLSIEPGV